MSNKYRYKVVRESSMGLFSVAALGKYKKYYEVGKEVDCVDGTYGIMCFDTIKNAKRFIKRLRPHMPQSLIILRVIPLCKATRCGFWTSLFLSSDISLFYKFVHNQTTTRPPYTEDLKIHPGSVCYKKIKVISIV